MTTYVYVPHPEPHKPTPDEQVCIDRFVAAFTRKKGGPPAGQWRVPGVGYCLFFRIPLAHLEPKPDGPEQAPEGTGLE